MKTDSSDLCSPGCTTWPNIFAWGWNAACWAWGSFYKANDNWKGSKALISVEFPSQTHEPLQITAKSKREVSCGNEVLLVTDIQIMPQDSLQECLSIADGYHCGCEEGKASRGRQIILLDYMMYLEEVNKLSGTQTLQGTVWKHFQPFFPQPLFRTAPAGLLPHLCPQPWAAGTVVSLQQWATWRLQQERRTHGDRRWAMLEWQGGSLAQQPTGKPRPLGLPCCYLQDFLQGSWGTIVHSGPAQWGVSCVPPTRSPSKQGQRDNHHPPGSQGSPPLTLSQP